MVLWLATSPTFDSNQLGPKDTIMYVALEHGGRGGALSGVSIDQSINLLPQGGGALNFVEQQCLYIHIIIGAKAH